MRAAKICNRAGCPDLVPSESETAYCPLHQPPSESGWASSGRVKPGNWRVTRAQVMRRDRYRCVICGKRASVVDHHLPQAWGGHEGLTNLRAMCLRDHRAKTGEESRLGRQMKMLSKAESNELILAFLQTWSR